MAATLKEGVNNTSNNKEEGMDGQTRRRLIKMDSNWGLENLLA